MIYARKEKLFWIAAGIGGCANCLQIGDEIKPIIRRLRKLHAELIDCYTGELDMPSTSKKQARTMAAIAHGWKPPKGSKVSKIPKKVAKEFNREDAKKGRRK